MKCTQESADLPYSEVLERKDLRTFSPKAIAFLLLKKFELLQNCKKMAA
jgi:hypothetical protein